MYDLVHLLNDPLCQHFLVFISFVKPLNLVEYVFGDRVDAKQVLLVSFQVHRPPRHLDFRYTLVEAVGLEAATLEQVGIYVVLKVLSQTLSSLKWIDFIEKVYRIFNI